MKRILLTLLAVLAAANLSAIDRGLGNPKSTYIEKGTFSAGISGAYYSYDAGSGLNLFGVLTGTDGKVSYIGAGVHVDWFMANNLSLVGMFDYTNISVDGDSANLVGMLDMSNKHLRRENFEASVGVRYYMPLFNSKIFALFSEGRLTGGRGYNKSYAETDRGKEGDYTDLYSLDLGLVVGLSVFVTDRVAVLVSLPKLSAGLEWENQIQNQARESHLKGIKVSTRPDLLGIRIGTLFTF